MSTGISSTTEDLPQISEDTSVVCDEMTMDNLPQDSQFVCLKCDITLILYSIN